MPNVKYIYHLLKGQAVEVGELDRIFPEYFRVSEEDGKIQLEVTDFDCRSAEDVRSEVESECDRVFFITGAPLHPEYIRGKNPDGIDCTVSKQKMYLEGYEPDPLRNLEKQCWQKSILLPVQLKLWRLAQENALLLQVKVMLLFQVVESSYPDTKDKKVYPIYKNSSKAPKRRTEAKLLRHFVSHQGAKSIKPQLEKYCCFLNVKCGFYDPTDATMTKAVQKRLAVVEQEAREIIEQAITTRGDKGSKS